MAAEMCEVRPRKDHRGVALICNALNIRSAGVFRTERYNNGVLQYYSRSQGSDQVMSLTSYQAAR